MTKAAVFQDPMFHDEDKAREALEAELWPHGPFCRHCGNSDPEKIAKMQGKSHRPGLYYCNECNGQFTVTVGTVLERSKVPLTKWLMAAHMFNSGKNGVSAHEIHRTLGVTYKTAWFMMHRLREAMNEIKPRGGSKIGGKGKSVQADETYYGNTSKRAKGYRKGHRHKAGVIAPVEPQGRARVFHVTTADGPTVRNCLWTTLPSHPKFIPMKACSTAASVSGLPITKPLNTHQIAVAVSMLAMTARPRTPPKTFSATLSVR